MMIVDTPQFDRLRSVKQLGPVHYVYPAAKHSRWEHSLGVMHLAAKFVDELRDKNEQLGITPTDRLCVMMAGLCHDLGHGPFSHLWEGFVREARPGHTWCHEQSSLDMFDYLIKENKLMPVFKQHGLTETDIIFVKEMIHCPKKDGKRQYQGRGPEKHFLYEIVANKISGIDVDKWDYFLRDNAAMKIGVNFIYERFILNSQILEYEGMKRVCIRDKEADNLRKLYQDRGRLHMDGYQHHTVKKIDRMVLDCLLSADEHLDCVRDDSGNFVPISHACDDPFTHSQLSDEYILRSLQNSVKPELHRAREILARIISRKFYLEVGKVYCNGRFPTNLAEMEQRFKEMMTAGQEEVVLVKKSVDMGMGGKNPLERVLFFDKKNRIKPVSTNDKLMGVRTELLHETLFVLCRNNSDDEHLLTEAKEAFNKWYKDTFKGIGFVSSLAD